MHTVLAAIIKWRPWSDTAARQCTIEPISLKARGYLQDFLQQPPQSLASQYFSKVRRFAPKIVFGLSQLLQSKYLLGNRFCNMYLWVPTIDSNDTSRIFSDARSARRPEFLKPAESRTIWTEINEFNTKAKILFARRCRSYRISSSGNVKPLLVRSFHCRVAS